MCSQMVFGKQLVMCSKVIICSKDLLVMCNEPGSWNAARWLVLLLSQDSWEYQEMGQASYP